MFHRTGPCEMLVLHHIYVREVPLLLTIKNVIYANEENIAFIVYHIKFSGVFANNVDFFFL